MQLSLLWQHQACRNGYRWETWASGHEVPSLLQHQAVSGYPAPSFHLLGSNRNGKFQSMATAHSSLSAQVRSSGCKPALCQAVRRTFFPHKASVAQKKLKNCRKTSLQKIPDELSDTLQKYWYLSLLFWHVLRGLWTGSSVVILYTLFSSFHLS